MQQNNMQKPAEKKRERGGVSPASWRRILAESEDKEEKKMLSWQQVAEMNQETRRNKTNQIINQN